MIEMSATIPSILDNVNTDFVGRKGWELASLPVGGLRDQDEVTAIRQQRAEQAEQQARFEQAMAAADMASKFEGGAQGA